MNILVFPARLLVGITFLLSGLIKLNDPLGFSFKLEEYMSRGVLNLPFLEPYALPIALVLALAESMLGVLLLLGMYRIFTLRSLLGMMVFFLFLTFYSAYFHKVTDCGCFGDALKLTPWQSFYKDAALLALTLVLLARRKQIRPLFHPKISHAGLAVALAGFGFLAYYVLNHLPLIDFRPYKIGVHIPTAMAVPINAPQPVYEYRWTFNINGKEKTIATSGAFPSVNGTFTGVETVRVEKGYEPPIHDFSMERNGQDYTRELLGEERLLLITAYDLQKASEKGLKQVKEVADRALKAGYKVVAITASTPEEAVEVREKYRLPVDFYDTDQTTLKTIIRSNPGIVKLRRGTILQKLHYNDAAALSL